MNKSSDVAYIEVEERSRAGDGMPKPRTKSRSQDCVMSFGACSHK